MNVVSRLSRESQDSFRSAEDGVCVIIDRFDSIVDAQEELCTVPSVMSAVFCRHICIIYYCYVLAIVLLLWYACICVLVECCCPIVQSVFQRADGRIC